MEKADAVKIIQQLANGIDPHSGEVFRADSPYQHPDTVRALFFALHALESDAAPKARAASASPTAPQNAGKPWSDEEDKTLAAAFDAGKQIPDLAAAHGRSRFAIEARLAKLGKIAPPPNMRGATRAASDRATYGVPY